MGLNSRQSGGGALDADARAYIAAVETALGTPIATALPSATSNPKRIISDFIKAEKAASRWSLHKRIYLPIYANAAASAIDMVSRTSGEFTLSGVTHAAGYVQGDGTSGYFNTLIPPSSVGITAATSMIFCLLTNLPATGSFIPIGSSNGADLLALEYSTTSIASYSNKAANPATLTLSRASQSGIITGSRNANNSHQVKIRRSTGVTSGTVQTAVTSGSPSTANIYAMAYNNNSSVANYYSGRLGACGFGLGMTDVNVDAFTLNLKSLYEGLTGITLP